MIQMSCNFCPASVSSENVAEVVRWDVSHDEVCPNATARAEALASSEPGGSDA